MTIGRVTLELSIGLPVLPLPAPAELMRALRGVEVTQQDAAPCGFQLTFLAEPVLGGGGFPIPDSPLLAPYNRVVLRVTVDGDDTTLIDGFITHQQYMPGNGPADPLFVVTGEDVSVMMDRVALSLEYPAGNDYEMVLLALAPWALLGVVPAVVPPPSLLIPTEYVPQQAETNRALLQRLAQQNGYVFYVTPGPLPPMNVAYWGPPLRIGDPAVVLDLSAGAATNVDSFSAEYDHLAPTTWWGLAMETEVSPDVPLPVVSVASTRLPPLALLPALFPGDPLVTRKLWPPDEPTAKLDPVAANFLATAMTTLSTDEVVKVTCEASVDRLGKVVTAPAMAGVRGTGEMYDGLYYLKSATHRISLLAGEQWDYKQTLVLTREGLGTTVGSMEVG